MTAKQYPLRHEDARPMYVSVPKEEYERMQDRIRELEDAQRWHRCGDPIVWGCEVISDWTNAEFMCRECCRNDVEDYCSAVGIHFGGVTFHTRRR